MAGSWKRLSRTRLVSRASTAASAAHAYVTDEPDRSCAMPTAVGIAQLLSGSSVTYAWAAEAAVLAWLTSRVRDSRFQLPAIAYLVLALGHALAFEASPVNFFTDVRHP